MGSVRNAEFPSEFNSRDTIVSVASFGFSCACVNNKGSVFYWGRNFEGSSDIIKPLKYDVKESKIVRVQIGYNFMVALTGFFSKFNFNFNFFFDSIFFN